MRCGRVLAWVYKYITPPPNSIFFSVCEDFCNIYENVIRIPHFRKNCTFQQTKHYEKSEGQFTLIYTKAKISLVLLRYV